MTAPVRQDSTVTGGFVSLLGQDFYQIQNYDELPPFLMNIVSVGDHWMYVSSLGGLTAGRVSADNCLFPYQTDDKLHDCVRHTGPITWIRYRETAGNFAIWQPLVDGVPGGTVGPRRLLKHVAGDQVIFEETNRQLGLAFRSGWRTSTRYGFVRSVTLENTGSRDVEIELVDGLRNLCPSGVSLYTYQNTSCLVDAYRYNEYDPVTGMGIYSLTAQILDRAEAAEVTRATTVWQHGLEDCVVFLSTAQLHSFFRGEAPQPEALCTGQRGNFFVFSSIKLAPGQSRTWYLVADVGRDHQQVSRIRKELLENAQVSEALEVSIREDHHELLRNVASADGQQATNSKLAITHHFANVLFNNMRGGVFADNYWVESRDFTAFLAARNRIVADAESSLLRALPERIESIELLALARKCGNTDLVRLTLEYLPLTFSRRHGDPSRPWNVFEIQVRNDDGSTIYSYQGNWRDIFQNWEALATSFPAFLPSMVALFVNASTVDGFNPYRITRNGIDWEVPDPEDPRSNIGYWSDHQIVYLTKLLEMLRNYFPGRLEQLLEEQIFCYAQVPYRIKPYDAIVADSNQTIDFDRPKAQEIDQRVESLGADGKLVFDSQGGVYYVSLMEKLLVPVLAKLSNLVVDGGIWLNTQRPEWNDANNALVGSGLSMVTVCYLRRHLSLLVELLRESGDRRLALSEEVEQWFRGIHTILQQKQSLLQQATIPAADRGDMLEAMGRAFSDYRLRVYDEGFSGKQTLASRELVDFFRLAIEYLDHSIRANRRAEGLYHTYNLLERQEQDHAVEVVRLYEMLEGQVAALGSGLLDAAGAVELVDAMFASQFYRDDQRSFMLYPERKLPGFLQRNQIAEDRVESVDLLRQLVEADDRTLVVRDVMGAYHFFHAIQKEADLEESLDRLARDPRWSALVASDRQRVLEVFEEVFHHKSYTGRSGTMYGYEGLGCIYWHMVSKLLLAVQENVFDAIDRKASQSVIEALVDTYYLVRSGLSSDKTPVEYGAFPTDPYSHTPKHRGAQQPGMTGQVKEEIVTRQGELGVRVRGGRLRFQPLLLRRREFRESAGEFKHFDVAGEQQRIELMPGSLAFTVCQVPVVYQLSAGAFSIVVTLAGGETESFQRDTLSAELSLKLFQRTGQIARVDVAVPEGRILRA